MTTNRWYLGSMNDALFIIDAPPRPSTDDVWHDRPDGPKLVLAVEGLTQERAQAIVDEHNKLIDQMEKLVTAAKDVLKAPHTPCPYNPDGCTYCDPFGVLSKLVREVES